jgi:putative chitinase
MLGPAAHAYAYPLETAMIKGGIVTPLEKAHFLAQVSHESGNFVHTEENLNYSWQGLRKTFKKYFPTDELAKQYERNPKRIANRVYANRYGNGNEASGEGWMYRGRGPIQLTFKDNYYAASHAIYGDNRLVLTPDMVKQPTVGSEVAVWFWNTKGCRACALADDIVMVTQKINGGQNGIDDRKAILAKIRNLFT